MAVIVVGYSAKPEGSAALDRAVDEARLRACSLVVVHTVEGDDLSALIAQLADSGLAFEVQPAGDALDPAEDVLRHAQEKAADFIVIGLKKRSPVGKLLLGSNAQRVLLDAACPVLAVKAAPRLDR